MLGNVADAAQKEAVAALQKALQSGDVEGAGKAWQQVINSISEKVKTDCTSRRLYCGSSISMSSRKGVLL